MAQYKVWQKVRWGLTLIKIFWTVTAVYDHKDWDVFYNTTFEWYVSEANLSPVTPEEENEFYQ